VTHGPRFGAAATDLKGLKARKIIAQGKRSETSAALGQRPNEIQALKGRKKIGARMRAFLNVHWA